MCILVVSWTLLNKCSMSERIWAIQKTEPNRPSRMLTETHHGGPRVDALLGVASFLVEAYIEGPHRSFNREHGRAFSSRIPWISSSMNFTTNMELYTRFCATQDLGWRDDRHRSTPISEYTPISGNTPTSRYTPIPGYGKDAKVAVYPDTDVGVYPDAGVCLDIGIYPDIGVWQRYRGISRYREIFRYYPDVAVYPDTDVGVYPDAGVCLDIGVYPDIVVWQRYRGISRYREIFRYRVVPPMSGHTYLGIPRYRGTFPCPHRLFIRLQSNGGHSSPHRLQWASTRSSPRISAGTSCANYTSSWLPSRTSRISSSTTSADLPVSIATRAPCSSQGCIAWSLARRSWACVVGATRRLTLHGCLCRTAEVGRNPSQNLLGHGGMRTARSSTRWTGTTLC